MNNGNLIAAGLAIAAAVTPLAAMSSEPSEESQAAKEEIWALEQSIYAGRARGDISNYANNTAQGYLAWPPTMSAPMRSNRLTVAPPERRQTQEQLTMTFMDFSLNGSVAVIYYKTHRVRLADGTPADDHFEVTHTWIKEDGHWKVFAGMARFAKP